MNARKITDAGDIGNSDPLLFYLISSVADPALEKMWIRPLIIADYGTLKKFGSEVEF